MKVVQILGMAPNLVGVTPMTPDMERWCSNVPRSYRIKYRPAIDTYTRWFNFHSRRHIQLRYPSAWTWYTHQSKPIYLQEPHADIKSSIRFPRQSIQRYFSVKGKPNTFFTCSVSWQIAFAIYEGFQRIELWGFELRRDQQYDFERPCFFYWIQQAQHYGVDVFLPPSVEISSPGDPTSYTGPLYGYEPHSDFYKASF